MGKNHALYNALALMGLFGGKFPDKKRKEDTKPKFTSGELEKLESLSGKEKKDYVKFLKEKYSENVVK